MQLPLRTSRCFFFPLWLPLYNNPVRVCLFGCSRPRPAPSAHRGGDLDKTLQVRRKFFPDRFSSSSSSWETFPSHTSNLFYGSSGRRRRPLLLFFSGPVVISRRLTHEGTSTRALAFWVVHHDEPLPRHLPCREEAITSSSFFFLLLCVLDSLINKGREWRW